MIFEINKCYEHTAGSQIHIIGEITTLMRGKGLLAEQYSVDSELLQVGYSEDNAVNWHEITYDKFVSNYK